MAPEPRYAKDAKSTRSATAGKLHAAKRTRHMGRKKLDLETVSAWCGQHDNHPTEAWLSMLLDGSVELTEFQAAVKEGREPVRKSSR